MTFITQKVLLITGCWACVNNGQPGRRIAGRTRTRNVLRIFVGVVYKTRMRMR